MTCQNKRKEDNKGYKSRVVKVHGSKPGIHDASFASKSPFKFLEFKFFDRVYHTRNLNQKT